MDSLRLGDVPEQCGVLRLHLLHLLLRGDDVLPALLEVEQQVLRGHEAALLSRRRVARPQPVALALDLSEHLRQR